LQFISTVLETANYITLRDNENMSVSQNQVYISLITFGLETYWALLLFYCLHLS